MDFIQHLNALENNRVLEFRLFKQKISLNLQHYITLMDEYYYMNKYIQNCTESKDVIQIQFLRFYFLFTFKQYTIIDHMRFPLTNIFPSWVKKVLVK